MTQILWELWRDANHLFARIQINADRRLRLYRELAGLMNAGYSQGEALDVLWKIASRNGLRVHEPMAVFLREARKSVQNGHPLSQAFKAWVPKEDHMLLMAIEGSDEFAHQLETWCTTLESRAGIRAHAASSLVYPGFLMVIAYGLLIYFDKHVLPILFELLPQSQWSGAALWFLLICSAASDYILPVALFAFLVPSIMLLALPRWSGIWRDYADRWPIFALYRSFSGLTLLQSLGTLMTNGLSASEAILRLQQGANPYTRRRLIRIRQQLLNGLDLGESMLAVSGGWPDPELALSMQALAHSMNFPAQILRLGKDWWRITHERTKRWVAIWRLLAFLSVFAVVSGVVSAMYEIQSQIAANIY